MKNLNDMDFSKWKLTLKVDQPNYIIARNTSNGDHIYISGVYQSKENAIKGLNIVLENYNKDSRPDGWSKPYLLQLTVSIKKIQ